MNNLLTGFLIITVLYAATVRANGILKCPDQLSRVEVQQSRTGSVATTTISYLVDRMPRLMAYDTKAWFELFDFFVTVGDPEAALSSALLPALLNMPASLREALDKRAAAAYPKAPRESLRKHEGNVVIFPPKRALAAYVHLTSDAQTMIRESVETGNSPAAALDNYFLHIRSRLSLGKAPYSGKTVLDLAETIQKLASKEAKKKSSGQDWEFVLFGGFINGRSSITNSDVDILSNNPEASSLLHPHFKEVHSYLEEVIPGSKLSLSFPTGPITREQASVQSPVQIRINPQGVFLEVFPPTTIYAVMYRIADHQARRSPSFSWPVSTSKNAQPLPSPG